MPVQSSRVHCSQLLERLTLLPRLSSILSVPQRRAYIRHPNPSSPTSIPLHPRPSNILYLNASRPHHHLGDTLSAWSDLVRRSSSWRRGISVSQENFLLDFPRFSHWGKQLRSGLRGCLFFPSERSRAPFSLPPANSLHLVGPSREATHRRTGSPPSPGPMSQSRPSNSGPAAIHGPQGWASSVSVHAACEREVSLGARFLWGA